MKSKNKQTGSRRARLLLGLLLLVFAGCAAACGKKEVSVPEVDYSVKGARDNTPRVQIPMEEDAPSGEEVSIDLSHKNEGYLTARYFGDAPRVKLRLTMEGAKTYTYEITVDGSPTVLPFSSGNGRYLISVLANVEDTLYADILSVEADVALESEFSPFLFPNQYCWFTPESEAVSTGAFVCGPADDDLSAVTLIYNYVISHVTYDWEEAETVESGYLPDVDEVLSTGRGICLDYASLMAAMLRSQGIPTRMEIGYAGTGYHAWITCYITDVGWVNGLIEFDGRSWSMMDPTFAASQGEKKLRKFIGDGSNYKTVYLY